LTNSKSNFVKGAAILAFTGLIVKFIGFFLKIILGRILGDEGIGLYMYAYPIYSTLLIIATAGIPIAVSKLVAEKMTLDDYHGAMKIFKVSFCIIMLTGLLFSVSLALGAGFLAENVFKDDRTFLPLLSISPAIFLVTIMAALRGFFQGQQNMIPTASSQLAEQFFRVAVSIGLVYLLIPRGLEYAAAGATFGAVAGALGGLGTILLIYFKKRQNFYHHIKNQESSSPLHLKDTMYRIGTLAAPIMAGSMIIPLTNLIDTLIVPHRLLQAGLEHESTALFGQLLGFAGSIIHIPTMLGIALTMTMVPAISEAKALGNETLVRHRVETSQRLALLFAIPAAAGIALLSGNITLMIFDHEAAGYPLSILAWSVIFSITYKNTTGIHQGLGMPVIPVKNMFLGGLVKIIITWFLTAVPSVNIGGAAIGTVAGFTVAALLNIHSANKLTGARLDFLNSILKPLFASALMSLLVYFTYYGVEQVALRFLSAQLANAAGVLSSVILGGLFYAVLLILTGAVKKHDLQLLPGRYGDKLSRWAEKTGLLKS